MIRIFLKGIVIGTVTAAPVGPVSILCIQQTINNGLRFGIANSVGVATADLLYAVISAFSVSVIHEFLMKHNIWCRIFGGILLIFFGIKTLILKSDCTKARSDISNFTKENSMFSGYITSMILTISNPMTILGFMSIFAAFKVNYQDFAISSVIVCGVFCGSLLLQSSICIAAWALKDKIQHNQINKIFSIIIIGFAILTFASVIMEIC